MEGGKTRAAKTGLGYVVEQKMEQVSRTAMLENVVRLALNVCDVTKFVHVYYAFIVGMF